MSSQVPPPLPQAAGYGVVVGLGVAFALGMVWVTKVIKITFNEDAHSTETFMVANRTIGTGLTACAVISSWLYSSALLGATLLTYSYGLALGVWWGASASTMVTFMSYLAIQAKRRAPNAHTMLEIIRVRYGKSAHQLWIFLCLLNNTFVFTSMVVGSSTAVSALTGMNVIASSYLLPLGVAVYTYFGGLKATFLTDYVHTFVIMIIICWFTIRVILVNEIGSISALYDAVVLAGKEKPVAGNYNGSYLTMRSNSCLFFGILHVTANIGAVIMDTGFWQKGFSAGMAAAVPGYALGGVASFSVPWSFGTVVGLAALALEKTAIWPTYPNAMTPDEVNAGLVLPYVAQAVAGKAGAGAILLVIFMSTTSIASAQMIATSSIISFDIYGTYVNRSPSNGQLIRWSHFGVVFSSLFISTLATAFHEGGVNMTWLLYMIGLFTCPGVFPTCLALLWERQTKAAAIASPIIGMLSGMAVWFGTAYSYYGEITIESTGGTMPCLFATLTSFLVPLPITVAISLLQQDEFDWSVFGQIEKVKPDRANADQKSNGEGDSDSMTPDRARFFNRASRWAAFWAIVTVCGHVLLWPLPMYGARMSFSKSLFIAWIVISLIWLWFTLVVAIFYPLVDGGIQQIWTVLKGTKAGSTISDGADSTILKAISL
ncbi:Sodium:solute symporter family-domain-containing protein [Aspergillus sergii]|uniref:Sodium:solute symporter family-domain-containing protein n=1 Tax=Aspergillus sergii TaxID=1034303 RepID=A0A5N6XMW2_9EURO|nr:Sodium:solute symporter family-domain-containing protein [Aspergillus sergii]